MIRFCQFLKTRQSTLDHFCANAIRRAEIPGAAEVCTGHEKKIVFPCPRAECIIIRFEGLGAELERPKGR